MAYSKEVLRRAREALAQQRADRESQNLANLEHAYTCLPRLREIDMQLRRTMAVAAQAVFAQNGNVEEAMNRAKEENLVLQAERKALVEANFKPGFLDGGAVCDHCGGSGYVGSAMCSCLKALCVQEQRKELDAIFTGNESFENFSLSYYSTDIIPQLQVSERSVMEKNLEKCRKFARSFSEDAGNVLISGGTGLGKTHLALAMGRAIGEQGYSVCYETAIGLFSKLEKARFTPTEENRQEAQRLESCDLLIIDDLGTELPGQFVTAALYGILNQRLMGKKSMIVTTNLTVDEVNKRYSPQIASRLYGDFRLFTFLGSDIRAKKNRG